MATTFKRWQATRFGGPGALELVTAPLPAPGPGELLLRVLAADATYTDLLVLAGNYPGVSALPCTPGYCCSAEVAATGEGVAAAAFAVGDAVLAMPGRGCAAEYVVVPAAWAVRAEGQASAAHVRAHPALAASLALTGVTAYQMLHREVGEARLRAPGAALLVHAAAGGTGAMLVQLAKLAGVAPARIIGTCSRGNLAAVRALGATAVCYEDSDWPAQARAALGGGSAGFSAVLDSVALQHYAAGIALLAPGGLYVAYGLTTKQAPGSLPLPRAIALFASLGLRHSLLHACFGAADALFYDVRDRRNRLPAEYAQDARALLQLAASGQLQVVVGATHKLADYAGALRGIAEGRHTGKQCVLVAAELQ